MENNMNEYYPDISKFWPGWNIVEEIGSGSYGKVYRAEHKVGDTTLQAAVKIISFPKDGNSIDDRIKELKSEDFTEEEIKKLIEQDYMNISRELNILVRLSGSNNVVYVQEVGREEKSGGKGCLFYIRMELLEPLHKLKIDQHVDEKEIIKIGKDICNALKKLKEENIIHRDIKPQNILWSEKAGQYKLSDFGIAKYDDPRALSCSIVGSPDYIAPEVFSGRYDSRIDIYSLGMVMYYYLNRKTLPKLSLENSMLPPPKNASPAMAEVIIHACAYDPNERFGSAESLFEALCQVENGTYVLGSYQISAPSAYDHSLMNNDDNRTQRVNQLQDNSHITQSIKNNTEKKKTTKKIWPFIIVPIIASVLILGVCITVFPSILDKNSNESESINRNETESNATTVYFGDSNDEESAVNLAIQEADKLALEGDYSGALERINDEQKIYPNSNDLKKKSVEYAAVIKEQTIENALTNARNMASNNDYLGAAKVLKEVKKEYPHDTELQSEYDNYRELCIKQLLNDSASMVANNDLEGAINLLREGQYVVASNELGDALTDCEAEYRAQILGEAEAAFSSNKYDDAINIIIKGLKVMPDDKELSEALSYYDLHQPVKFFSMLDADNDDFPSSGSFGHIDSAQDPEGNNYSNVIFVNRFAYNAHDYYYHVDWWYCFKTVDLDFQYKRLTGVLFQNEKYSTASTQTKVIIEGFPAGSSFYTGGVILWEDTVSGDTGSKSFDVDLSGMQFVTISFLGDNTAGSQFEAYNYAYLSDVYVWK